MNHKVHHVVGLVAAEATLITFNQPAFSIVTVAGVFGGYVLSMAPDLDDSGSFMGRHQPFRMISLFLEKLPFIKHRGFTHSLLAVGLLYLLCSTIPIPEVLLWCFVTAYASHIVIDMLTPGGVEVLFPLKFRIALLPQFLAISSDEGSVGQKLFEVLFTIVFYFLSIHLIIEALHFTPWIGQWLNDAWQHYVVSRLPQEIIVWLN